MKLFAVSLLFLVALAGGQTISRLADMQASSLFTDAGPVAPSQQLPQSYRTFYSCYQHYTPPFVEDVSMNNFMPIELSQAPAAAFSIQVKLEAPYLEVDPYQCAGGAAAGGNCRCNVPTAPVVPGNPQTVNFAAGVKIANFDVPTYTYFEHAPYPGQSPWMKTYRKMCIQYPGDAFWRDTTVWVAVVNCCQTDTQCTTQTDFPYSWKGEQMVADFNADQKNFNVSGAIVPCNSRNFLGAWFDFNVGATTPALLSGVIEGVDFVDGQGCYGETPEMTVARKSRTVCCGGRTGGTLPRFGTATLTKRGTCINTAIDSCCGWKPFNSKYEQCCSRRSMLSATIVDTDNDDLTNADSALIQYTNQRCPCRSDQAVADCQRYGPNSGSGIDSRGELDTLVTSRLCCVMTKYAEFNVGVRRLGYCYTSGDASQMCCDDGNVYDSGAQQCCKVSGVQSLNMPCPCDRDTQCAADQKCCMQQWPPSWTEGQGPNVHGDRVWRAFQSTAATSTYLDNVNTGFPATFDYDNSGVRAWVGYFGAQTDKVQSACDKYANWPEGNSPAEINRCLGNCINPTFQTCCNGAICVKQYDRCCNNTCCNRFTSGCMEGYRPGSRGAGSRVNPNDYRVPFESCTSIEIFTTRRAFWVWVMPTFWCIATVFSLAIVAVVARRATENVFPLTERAVVIVSLICLLFSTLHFFAPTYKYGIVIVFTSMFVIMGAVSQSAKMSLASVILVVLMLILWFDPFEGNIYLSLTGGFVPTAGLDPTIETRNFPSYFSGILEALFRYERNRADCVAFYDYFAIDPMIHDTARFTNPHKTTFGFCTRAWMTTLLIFSIATLAFLLVLLVLTIFSFVKKVMPKSVKEDLAYELPLDAAPY